MFDWDGFKNKKFAVKCTDNKESFFVEVRKNGIHVFMGKREKLRNYFICVLRYDDRFSKGRLELWGIEEWQTKPNMLFGQFGLPVIDW